MKKDTISIIKTFSIFNPNCPQLIIEMEDGSFWSCAKLNNSNWKIVKVEFDTIRKSVQEIFWDTEITRTSFDELETAVWEMVNDVKIKEVA